jgi:hypothetical protein
MRKPPKPNRIPYFFLALVFVLSGSSRASAGQNKFDFGFGYFSVTAKSATGAGSTSGPGLYQINFRRAVLPKIELTVGYTIYFSSLISGDSGSGLDLGANYFPFTFAGPVESSEPGASITLEQIWRPFVGATFNQRNFQSVQSTYTGYGLHIGLERSLTEQVNITGTARSIKLTGTRQSTGTETDFFFALGFKF